MRFKLHENLSGRPAWLFAWAAHHAATARVQGTVGEGGAGVPWVRADKGRVPVTPDLDCTDIGAYPPSAIPASWPLASAHRRLVIKQRRSHDSCGLISSV